MPRFFDYNPDNGTWIEDETDADGNLTFKTWQDVQPILDRTKEKRNSGQVDKGIKRGFWHYATIPPVVEMELRQKGIKIGNPNQTKELLKEINTNYPYLKNTDLTHNIK
jgi:hypothetical protein